jgi:hypothetical protein
MTNLVATTTELQLGQARRPGVATNAYSKRAFRQSMGRQGGRVEKKQRGGPFMSPRPGSLADRFGAVPFSTLDARGGHWTNRRRFWNALGFDSAAGRADKLTYNSPAYMTHGKAVGNTSKFDPVLAEVLYRWFCPPGGRVLDPFAGGVVRGLVATAIGLDYVGVDLSETQLAANRDEWARVWAERPAPNRTPEWRHGDSARLRAVVPERDFDFAIACPPYFDLERYGGGDADLSEMRWPEFCGAYRLIIASVVAKLANDRFAAFVVGNLRDRNGLIRDLGRLTVEAFEAAGAGFYNDGILCQPLATLPMRASRNFPPGRKLGRAHQLVLVFVKGDARKAALACTMDREAFRPVHEPAGATEGDDQVSMPIDLSTGEETGWGVDGPDDDGASE